MYDLIALLSSNVYDVRHGKAAYTPPCAMSTRAAGGVPCVLPRFLPQKDNALAEAPSILRLDGRRHRLYHHDAHHGHLLLVWGALCGDHCRLGLESSVSLIALFGGVDFLCRHRVVGGTTF